MNYPPADTSAAWFANRYPGSKTKPNVGVIHTTEGMSLPTYSGGATAPHYTAVPDMKNRRLRWFAHFPDFMSARALRNDPGGVETNTLNALQVELVGTCDPRTSKSWKGEHIFWPDAPDWAMEDLSEFIAWCWRVHGIPVRGPRGDATWQAYPASYGEGNANRLSMATWRMFTGWCGHQHVPENDHGDPGAFAWGDLAKLALQTGPDPVPMVVDVSVVQEAFRRFLTGAPAQADPVTRRNVRRIQRALNNAYPQAPRLEATGIVNNATVTRWKTHEKDTAGRNWPGVPDWESIRHLVTPRYTITPK